MKVTHGLVSFTEVEPGEHQSYNDWHLFDHMPEQFPLAGIAHGERWVLTPELKPFVRAEAPLDRIHYVTLYLMSEPIDDTLADFRALAVELRDKDRFHMHRTSHLSGALAVRDCTASATALVSGEAIPYRPHRGVHVVLTTGDVAPVVDQPGVAGAWTFHGDEHSPPELQDTTAIWYWLDTDPSLLAMHRERFLPSASQEVVFSATFARIDPWGSFAWFDNE